MWKVEKITTKEMLVIVSVVAFVHYTLVLGVFYSELFLSRSTVQCGHAIGIVLHVVYNILMFPRDILVEWIPSIDVGLFPLLLNSLLWGVAAYVVILIYHVIKRPPKKRRRR